MDCKGHPRILEETWERIRNQDWVRGGWEIDGTMHWLAKDHPGTGGRVAWHLWADDGRPMPARWVRCFFPQAAWEAIAGGELIPERNCIRKGEIGFCFVSAEGDNVELSEWPFEERR